MNQSKFVKVFDALIGSGLSSKEASKIAFKVAGKPEEITIKRSGNAKRGNDSGSLKARILAFATKRKGAVWSLQNCARVLNVDPNNVSAQLTIICKAGRLERTGRGEYRTSH